MMRNFIFSLFIFLYCHPSLGLISFVQIRENNAFATSDSISTGTFTSPTTSGNLLVCTIQYNSATQSVISVTDTASNTYFKSNGPTTGATTINDWRSEIWYSYNITGQSSLDITANLSATFSAWKFIICSEYTGVVSLFDPLDGASSAAVGSANFANPGTITTTQDNDLIYQRCITDGSTPFYGWVTPRSSFQENTIADRVYAGPVGNYNLTCQGDSSTASHITQSVAFKALSTGLGPGIALVQGDVYSEHDQANSSIAKAFSANNTAGNFIVVGIYLGNDVGRTLTVSDSRGNIYNLATSINQVANGHLSYIYYAMNIASGPNTITVSTTGGAVSHFVMHFAEYKGIATSNALDQTSSNTANSASVTSNATATTTTANELLIGMFGFSGVTDNDGYGVFTPTSSFVYRGMTNMLDGNYQSGFAHRVVSSTGTYAATANTPFNEQYSALIATFKAQAIVPRIKHKVISH